MINVDLAVGQPPFAIGGNVSQAYATRGQQWGAERSRSAPAARDA